MVQFVRAKAEFLFTFSNFPEPTKNLLFCNIIRSMKDDSKCYRTNILNLFTIFTVIIKTVTTRKSLPKFCFAHGDLGYCGNQTRKGTLTVSN